MILLLGSVIMGQGYYGLHALHFPTWHGGGAMTLYHGPYTLKSPAYVDAWGSLLCRWL